MKDKSIQNDFAQFCNETHQVPGHLDQLVLNEIMLSKPRILAKIVMVQLFTSTLSLAFCPQFNFSLTNNYELFHFFHHTFGAEICMMLCAAIFMGSGALVAGSFISNSEFAAIKRSSFLYLISFTAVALGAFILLGAQVFATLTLYWAISAILTGALFFNLGNLVVRNLRTV